MSQFPLLDALPALIQAHSPAADTSQLGTVSAVNAGGTVDVSVPTGTVPKVRYLASYSPVAGDLVVVVTMPTGDRYIPGKLA